MEKSNGKCCCPCHKMLGILIALFGLSFLLRNAGVLSDSIHGWIWPTLIVLGGLKHTFAGSCKCCDSEKCCKT